MPQSVALLFCGDEPAHGRVNRHLNKPSGICLGGSTAGQVIAVLKSTPLRLVTCTNWRGFRRSAAATHAAVMVALRLDLDGITAGLRGTANDGFPCPLVLVTAGVRENLRHLGSVRVTDVVFADEVRQQLARVITTVTLSEGRVLLRAAVRRREMHVALRRALLELFDRPFPEPGRDRASHHRFPRTVQDLAHFVGLSADYLRHLAVDARIPLGRIMHRHVALRALEMLAAGECAASVARCLGYRSTDGVQALITRNFRTNVTELLKVGIHRHYVETAILIDVPLGSPAPAEAVQRRSHYVRPL